ncbi:MAG: hypothetical protein Q8O14_07925 [bacterium]|nr:hypothetical protein [bacterium]
MDAGLRRRLTWLPRVLMLIIAAFLSVFALDALQPGQGAVRRALTLALHLIPAGMVVLTAVASWRREWIGAIVSLGAGAWSLALWSGHWSAKAGLGGALLLAGLLYGAAWILRLWESRKGRPAGQDA